ncbi:MAG: alpha/beta hydrolase [Alphaproteobacteria bacterium]|nr:alpha/beta hydrolase [Alphaproteobacteria bacterium]
MTLTKKMLTSAAALSVLFTAGCASICHKNPTSPVSMVKEWDKVFPKSDKVNHKKVTFKNRYGLSLVADLYVPKNLNGKTAAIAVSGPFGAVKEQSSGLYAQTMAERGFVTLAFDPSYTGESGGQPRNVASPDINTEDFSAAVDYLTTLPEVDDNKIGIIGICGWGGFALNAAAMDTRIKATVTSTMYDMTRVSAKGYNDSMSAGDLYKMRQNLNNQRTVAAKTGKPVFIPTNKDKLNGDEPQFIKDYHDYYKEPLGFHSRSINSNGGWNSTSSLSLITQPILSYADTIKSVVLMIHGEKAHSRYFSEGAFKKLTGKNKELMIIPGANHTDLYYKTDVIPFDKMERFFKTNLK